MTAPANVISIHALLAESDAVKSKKGVETIVISIHALLAESDNIPPDSVLIIDISIHALLAESDKCTLAQKSLSKYFYPRSPCGERPKF